MMRCPSLNDAPCLVWLHTTAGPLALAKAHLVTAGATDDPFFVFNSDVTCRYPLKELLEFHNNHGAEGTIIVRVCI